MDVLPARIEPPTGPIHRRHAPTASDYRLFRACVRWDFGFTCPFCLTHETDWAPSGVERLGLFTIEHFVLKSVDPETASDYANCLYACRLCNVARSIRPNQDRLGRKLLDPSAVAWSEHFALDGGHLRPAADDHDAQYTHEAYDLDEPHKGRLRLDRETAVTEALKALTTAPALIVRLLDTADGMPVEERQPLLDSAEALRGHLKATKAQLAVYRPVPVDAPSGCTCESPPPLTLPPFLANAVSHIP